MERRILVERKVRAHPIVVATENRIRAGADALSEGETLKGWRLESISPKVVMLSGPAGNIVLKPKCLNLNRNSCIMLSNIAGHKVRLIF